MLFEKGKLQQLKICFLFMYADGEASASELKYLDDILAKENLSDESVEKFQAFRSQMTSKLTTGNSKTVIAEIDELLGEKTSSQGGGAQGGDIASQMSSVFNGLIMSIERAFSGDINGSRTMQAQTIWTLINLGYADSEYSEAEKAVVNHLVERWKMDPVLVDELNDTAETILALILQKEWVQSTAKTEADTNRIIQELDRNIASMFTNVETSISEANIVQEES